MAGNLTRRVTKKEKNESSSLQYPLRAWHKPALSGIESGFFTYGLG